MDRPTVNLGWFCPDLLNLHGERGSVQAFVREGENLGIDVNVRVIADFDDDIPFDELDIIMVLPGEIKTLQFMKPALEEKLPQLKAYLERGGYLIAIGTSGLLFGKSVEREDGSVLEGLGLLNMTAKERAYVYGNDLHFRLNGSDMEIIGSQIQMADVSVEENTLGETLYGFGNNGGGAEGARYLNLIYTNCLGPVFVKNPWWTGAILKDVCSENLSDVDPKWSHALEEASFKAYLKFLKSKQA